MTEPYKKLAQRTVLRASSGLYFLKDILRNRSGGTDTGYSRSWYLLLSYNFELILISIFILAKRNATEEEIISALLRIKPSHDFEKLYQAIPLENTLEAGILKVKRKSNRGFIEYEVHLHKGRKVIIQDLVDVRYDFKKDSLRLTDSKEVDRIKEEINSLRDVIENLKPLLWPATKI